MRRRRRNGPVIALLLIIILIMAGAIAAMIIYAGKKQNEPKINKVSITDEIAAKTYVWLSEIEQMNLSYEEISEMYEEINVDVILTKTKGKNTYEQKLDESSYEEARIQAKEKLENIYRKAISNKIKSEGYENDFDDRLVDDLMQEAYNMSVSEYIEYCNVDYFPSKEKMSLKYSGEIMHE